MREPRWLVPAVGAALSGVLCSGLTAAYLRATLPETFAVRGDLAESPERRHLAALLVAPGEPFRPDSAGAPVDAAALGSDGLDALGFRRGWTRTWRAPDGERVDAFVLEFGDDAGAAAYARNLGRAARLLARPVPFAVTGVPGGSGLADTVADRDGRYAQLVALHRGPWAVLLVVTTAARAPGARVVELARRQWGALGGT